MEKELQNNHPDAEVVAESTAVVEKDKLQGKWYSSIEDLLACKAFIAASEDPLKGTSQRTLIRNMYHGWVS